jgi:hypothetical protein
LTGCVDTRHRANTLENFSLVFSKKFFETVFKRMDANEDTFKKIIDDDAFAATLRDYFLGRVYGTLRAETPGPAMPPPAT